jgi:hypothetical protein
VVVEHPAGLTGDLDGETNSIIHLAVREGEPGGRNHAPELRDAVVGPSNGDVDRSEAKDQLVAGVGFEPT